MHELLCCTSHRSVKSSPSLVMSNVKNIAAPVCIRGFYNVAENDNNGNIGIGGFTVGKEKNKM